MANDAIMKWSATTTTVIDLTADLTNNSVAGGTRLLDNSTELMPYARATFNNPGTFGAAPTNNSTVNLYAVLQDTDGTSDDTAAPTGSDVESARFMGAFTIYDTDEEQRCSIDIDLMGIQKAYFYIENKTGQTITCRSATLKLRSFWVTPSRGP